MWTERAVAIKQLTFHNDDGGRAGKRNLFWRGTKEVHVPDALVMGSDSYASLESILMRLSTSAASYRYNPSDNESKTLLLMGSK